MLLSIAREKPRLVLEGRFSTPSIENLSFIDRHFFFFLFADDRDCSRVHGVRTQSLSFFHDDDDDESWSCALFRATFHILCSRAL